MDLKSALDLADQKTLWSIFQSLKCQKSSYIYLKGYLGLQKAAYTLIGNSQIGSTFHVGSGKGALPLPNYSMQQLQLQQGNKEYDWEAAICVIWKMW